MEEIKKVIKILFWGVLLIAGNFLPLLPIKYLFDAPWWACALVAYVVGRPGIDRIFRDVMNGEL